MSEHQVMTEADTIPQQEERVEPEVAPTEEQRFFRSEDAGRFREDWRAVQVDFVDDPRASVRRAHELVAQTINSMLDEHRQALESSGETQTEDLRLAMQRYRTFFHQMLAM